MTTSKTGKDRPPLQELIDRACREAERAEAEAAHMHKWAAAERAKGPPGSRVDL